MIYNYFVICIIYSCFCFVTLFLIILQSLFFVLFFCIDNNFLSLLFFISFSHMFSFFNISCVSFLFLNLFPHFIISVLLLCFLLLWSFSYFSFNAYICYIFICDIVRFRALLIFGWINRSDISLVTYFFVC